MQAGWLDDLTNWLRETLEGLLAALLEALQSFALFVVEMVMQVFATIVEAIPVPDFLANGLGGMFSFLPPEILYFVDLFNIPEGLALVGAGVAFRLLRKLLTLGQW